MMTRFSGHGIRYQIFGAMVQRGVDPGDLRPFLSTMHRYLKCMIIRVIDTCPDDTKAAILEMLLRHCVLVRDVDVIDWFDRSTDYDDHDDDLFFSRSLLHYAVVADSLVATRVVLQFGAYDSALKFQDLVEYASTPPRDKHVSPAVRQLLMAYVAE